MDRELVLERMRREKIIAIVRGVETASIGEVALALAAGGITCMEITVDHRTKDGPEETYRSIAWLRERMGFVKPETTIGPALDQAFAQATRKIIVMQSLLYRAHHPQ